MRSLSESVDCHGRDICVYVCMCVVCHGMGHLRVLGAGILLLELFFKVVFLSCGLGVRFGGSFMLSVIATCLPLCLGAALVRMDKVFPE